MSEESVAMVMANCARAMILAMGMQAENQARAAVGLSVAYPEEAFSKLVEENDLGYNSVITLLRN